MNNLKILLTGVLSLFVTYASPAQAEVGRKAPGLDGLTTAGPYYNPASKSYFELFRFSKITERPNWQNAQKEAATKFFKNTQGRLATIKNLETHQFILRNFKAKDFWIGLQYYCGSGSLIWVDGTDATKSGFSAWANQWSNTDIRCAAEPYMPVHYTTKTVTGTLRWRASGARKFYGMYLVEYPTGKE